LDTVAETFSNPFERSTPDIPMTQISRTFEIDMKDMLDKNDLSAPILLENNIVL